MSRSRSFLSFVELLDMAVNIVINVTGILLVAREHNKRKKTIAIRNSVDPIKTDSI